jgi:hypothetical protein
MEYDNTNRGVLFRNEKKEVGEAPRLRWINGRRRGRSLHIGLG